MWFKRVFSPIQLPETLCRWIDQHLPALPSAELVRFKVCERIPFWWIPGNKGMQGLTLWNTVYLARGVCATDILNPQSVELIFHELIHVEQFGRNPLLFPFKYAIWHLRYGYWANPAEVEARDRAATLSKIYFRDARLRESSGSLSP